MRIRFLSDQIYETGGIGKGPAFPKGFVLDGADVAKALGLAEASEAYSAAFLNRWVNRGVAEIVDGRAPQSDVETVEVAGGEVTNPVTAPLGTSSRGGPTPGLDDGKQVQKPDYSTMTRADLDELAGKRKVDVSDAKNKGDVIAALELADELGPDA